MENVELNESGVCMNQSSSADMKFKCQNASSQATMVDGSSVVLKSLLGVDDYYSAMNDAYQNQTMNLSNEKVRSNFKEDEMPSDLLKNPVGTGTLLAPQPEESYGVVVLGTVLCHYKMSLKKSQVIESPK